MHHSFVCTGRNQADNSLQHMYMPSRFLSCQDKGTLHAAMWVAVCRSIHHHDSQRCFSPTRVSSSTSAYQSA